MGGLSIFRRLAAFSLPIVAALTGAPALAADVVLQDPEMRMMDPPPVPGIQPAVDGVNFKFSAVTGSLGGHHNHMFIASLATPVPFAPSFGAQVDLGIGKYRDDYTSAAAGLHLFYRDPDRGLLGIYGDWAYVNPEHAGRVGVEAALYNDRWTLDLLLGKQFGQHVYTKFIDEVDLSYYFTDNFRGSIGHRLISRGHVGNISFEYLFANTGWSLYGEAETGEDDYHGAWLGLRYAFGQGKATTLIARDRTADPMVRIPRNLASVTQCGNIAETKGSTWWRHEMDNLCASEEEIEDEGGVVRKK